MQSIKNKNVLVSGASIAGLSTAYWLNKLGYRVTIVEMAHQPRTGGAAINIQGAALESAKRMGIYEQLKAHALQLVLWEFKNADDVTAGAMDMLNDDEPLSDGNDHAEEIEIERDKLIFILMGTLKTDVEFIFGNSITALNETQDGINVTFKSGLQRNFDLVFGCDGLHSAVRKIWFGHEAEYSQFLQYYFSITIVNKLLIKESTAQMYNVPDKMVMLNAYNNKTDIVFCFFSEKEIVYDYRNAEQQKQIILEQFAGQGWKTPELLEEIKQAKISYFDKISQIRMPSWTKGRVALVGDAGYCASPAAGYGASLAMAGAVTIADALEKHNGNFEAAFFEYDQNLRPFIEAVQTNAVNMLSNYLIPRTEEAIQLRNTQQIPF